MNASKKASLRPFKLLIVYAKKHPQGHVTKNRPSGANFSDDAGILPKFLRATRKVSEIDKVNLGGFSLRT